MRNFLFPFSSIFSAPRSNNANKQSARIKNRAIKRHAASPSPREDFLGRASPRPGFGIIPRRIAVPASRLSGEA
jgi:hypothetical protein